MSFDFSFAFHIASVRTLSKVLNRRSENEYICFVLDLIVVILILLLFGIVFTF